MVSTPPSRMSPENLRAYVVIFTGDIAPCGAALWLIAGGAGPFQVWMLPLVAGLFGVPAVRPRAGSGGGEGK